ncbi:transcriptional regulator family: Fungal Specific TF [Penicillium taxi]|uniref:transcriptional regulator family: Fungal Specific TF n=1 Tax=Penicillium taxi TaxID=168475 RepID=UPI0025455343|nr:transcriptional regulator family: Fungal Specific TF [Penicillium taxi]KAJ5888322.1 transcriptional regulator family: Fungal Specific TF [Penicillium taxi]
MSNLRSDLQNSESRPQSEGRERPYRSHSRPACLSCRSRKSRCTQEANFTICLACRAHGTECLYPEKRRKNYKNHVPYSRNQSRLPTKDLVIPATPQPDLNTAQSQHPRTTPTFQLAPSPQINQSEWPNTCATQDTPLALDAENDNPHIIGPAIVRDSHVLVDYLSSAPGNQGMRSIRCAQPSGSSPIVFTKVEKRPLGMLLNSNPAFQKLQIIEKLLEPWGSHLVELYMKKINPCFPLFDASSFQAQYHNAKDRISPALLACLYGHMLPFWRYDPKLSQVRRPDDRFIWNLACEALYSELHLSPGISTITAILINVNGRPTTSMIGNGVQFGAAVALCNSLGLNRNPIPWDIPDSEKHFRIKIWWSVLIHDRWSSLSYGTPPHIRRFQYDVPPPKSEYFIGQYESAGALEVFIALAELTSILDYCLEEVYNITVPSSEWNLHLKLNKWVETLRGDVRKIIIRGVKLDIPGASNLRLAYLSMKLLIQRINLDRGRQSSDSSPELLANQSINARRTTEEIVILVQELQEAQLGDFWLPVAAFTFVSTVTFLIRVALEMEQSPDGLSNSPSLLMADEFLTSLRVHKENMGWDLADMCLAQHSEVVQTLLRSTPTAEKFRDATSLHQHQPYIPDMAFIDAMFPSIWDTLQSMYQE